MLIRDRAFTLNCETITGAARRSSVAVSPGGRVGAGAVEGEGIGTRAV
ncbi:hypothetical protein GCM10008959_28230 [Deinococcus seoulensis]|uniref:Uncharacterized protein n=1 Tax=Deinococcus seoulensis TaxID=1837379 RepID=A0ABQ2RTR1_9DEIO|nr:hypothetical protein GCM10008959_28230 [Deinococcus seoulensis]